MSTPDEPVVPEAQSTPLFTPEQLQAMIEQAIAKEREASQAQINQLKTSVETLSAAMSGTTPALVTQHGGGPYNKIAETWSFLEQTAMNVAREAPALAKLAATIEAAL